MTVYREPTPPPPDPPEPPDPDFVALQENARRRGRILAWGPLVAMVALLGVIALTQGVGIAIFALAGTAALFALGKMSDIWRRSVDAAEAKMPSRAEPMIPSSPKAWRWLAAAAVLALATMPVACVVGWDDRVNALAWYTLFHAGGGIGLILSIFAWRAWDAPSRARRVAEGVRAFEAKVASEEETRQVLRGRVEDDGAPKVRVRTGVAAEEEVVAGVEAPARNESSR